jgi:hypothetical protein
VIRRALVYAIALVLLGACTGGGDAGPRSGPTGPPDVGLDVVREHAEQFDDDIPDRRAGSQEELAAATYITGHLQQAGYVVLLDAVPVRDLVRSTNVVARPPSGTDPEVVVAVRYDTSPSLPDGSEAIGVFLEVARALRVREREHSVGFVALGAESTDVGGGRLGSRRLAQELVDEGAEPTIVELQHVGPDADFTARGSVADDLIDVASRVGIDKPTPLKTLPDELIWQDAGFDYAFVGGTAEDIARVLLDYLSRLTSNP